MSKLLFGGPFPFKPIGKPRLIESVGGAKTVRVEGVFQNFKVVNENGRRYPEPIWQKVFEDGSSFRQRLESRAVLGMIEHPEDGITRLDRSALVVTEARIASPAEIAANAELEEGDIIGAYETLPTPDGKILEALLTAGVRFGVSSRGSGTVSESGDCVEVNDDFELETWDAVFSPSVTRAIPKMRAAGSDNVKLFQAIESVTAPGKPSSAPSAASAPAPSTAMPLIESSFVLATGIMNCGEKLIPVQLIAESIAEVQSFTWRDSRTLEPLANFSSSPSFEEAIRKFTTFCESNGHTYDLPILSKGQRNESAPAKPTNKPTSRNPMQALQEMRKVKAGVIQLRQTQTRRLKPSDKVAFFEAVDAYRSEISRITAADATQLSEATRILKMLEEFEDELDAAPAPAPAPEDELAPIPGDDEGGEDASSPEEVADILDHAAEIIDELGGGENEEAADLADELRDISAELAPAGPEDEGEVGGEELPPIEGSPMESVRRRLRQRKESKKGSRRPRTANRTERKLVLSNKRYARLKEAAEKLFKKVKESSSAKGEGRTGLGERAQRFEEAARELANRYNTDMKEMGIAVIRLQRPDLWEQYGAKLLSARSFKEFTAFTESITKKHPAPASGKPAPASVTESTQPTPPADPGNPSSSEDTVGLEESHPALQMVTRARKHSCKHPD